MTYQVTPAQVVSPIPNSLEDRDHPPSPSEELASISLKLKEVLDGLRGWVKGHALVKGSSITQAARELSSLDSVFRTAHDELLSYTQQIPDPSDAPAAYEMLLLIERCFLEQIDRETSLDLPQYGFRSWGALMLSPIETVWTEDLVQTLLDHIDSESWSKVRQILSDTKNSLIP